MKKLIAITVLSVLTACGASTDTASAPRPTMLPKVTTTVPAVSGEDLYLDLLYAEYPLIEQQLGTAYVLEVGYTICDLINQGYTMLDFAQVAVVDGIDPTMFGTIIGFAVGGLCPENMWFFEAYN